MAIPEHPELTWSRSHSKMLRTCQRQWFYSKMLNWQGWSDHAPQRRRGAYMLKQVTSLPAIRGSIVHDLIDDSMLAIKAGKIDLDELVAEAMRRFELAWNQSVEGRWQDSPKHCTNFYEHLYGFEPDRREAFDATEALARKSFSALLNEFDFAAKLNTLWQDVHTFSFKVYNKIPVFYIEGAKIHALPDFVGVRPDGGVDLIDWKTGREHAVNRAQIAFYYLTARQGALNMRTMIRDNTPLRGTLVYLAEGAREVEVAEEAEDLEMLREQIRLDVAKMRGLANVIEIDNKTLLEVKDEEEATFALADDKSACAHCNFLFLCRQELGLGDREATKRWLKQQRAAEAGEWLLDEDDESDL